MNERGIFLSNKKIDDANKYYKELIDFAFEQDDENIRYSALGVKEVLKRLGILESEEKSLARAATRTRHTTNQSS